MAERSEVDGGVCLHGRRPERVWKHFLPESFLRPPRIAVSSVSAGFGRFEACKAQKKWVDRPVCLIRDKARKNGGKLRKKATTMEKKLERTIKKERAAGLLQRRPFLQSNPKWPGTAEGMGYPSRLRCNACLSPPHPIVFRASPSEEDSSAKEVTLRARPPPPDPLPRRGGGVFVRKHCAKAQQSAEYRRFPPPLGGGGQGEGSSPENPHRRSSFALSGFSRGIRRSGRGTFVSSRRRPGRADRPRGRCCRR